MDTSKLTREKLSAFRGTSAEWDEKRAAASLIIRSDVDETLYFEHSIEETDGYACAADKPKAPYGDVHYCDPGYQADKKKRFPVNTGARAKAAWSYAHHTDIMSKYSPEHLSALHSCIASAYKKFFGEAPKTGGK